MLERSEKLWAQEVNRPSLRVIRNERPLVDIDKLVSCNEWNAPRRQCTVLLGHTYYLYRISVGDFSSYLEID